MRRGGLVGLAVRRRANSGQNARMNRNILIAGGGIGGLAAALACARAGWPAQLIERAVAFGEVGAGIQMGPNVVRLLHGWGLEPALQAVAAYPQALQVRGAAKGVELARLRLGARVFDTYGAPYVAVHRADLLDLLLNAVRQERGVQLHLGQSLEALTHDPVDVRVVTLDGQTLKGDALIGADGLWSRTRQLLLHDAPPRVTGHLAYRAMVAQSELPERLRSQNITVWLGPKLHVVQYPVRCGEMLNVVGIVQGRIDGYVNDWSHRTNARLLRTALQGCCADLQDLVAGIGSWTLWALCDRPPMVGPHEQAQGRVALLGDAAHPMRPYLAQGAGMAIEDAACLQQVLGLPGLGMAERLQHYARRRWQRNARVQARSIRNGQIFHATGPLRWGRDLAMRLLGERLLDVPWLYRGAVD